MQLILLKSKPKQRDGFSLLELLIAIVITTVGATSALPAMQQQFKQASVDAYTNKIEAGLTHLKANLLRRQNHCQLSFPSGSTSSHGITPNQLESMVIDHTSLCPRPTSVSNWNGQQLEMRSSSMRLVNQKKSLRSNQASDLRIIASPQTIDLTTIGGVAAPTAGGQHQALTLRIYSQALKRSGKGFEHWESAVAAKVRPLVLPHRPIINCCLPI